MSSHKTEKITQQSIEHNQYNHGLQQVMSHSLFDSLILQQCTETVDKKIISGSFETHRPISSLESLHACATKPNSYFDPWAVEPHYVFSHIWFDTAPRDVREGVSRRGR